MTDSPHDRSKSIEQLSGYYWLAPDFESNVVLKSHAMRRKPLAELSLEDIRMGVMQQVGVSYLVPLALEVVEKDPYAESLNFPAEIAEVLFNIPFEYWCAHKKLQDRLQRVFERIEETKDTQDDYWLEHILPDIRKAHARFRGELPSKDWLRPLEIEREREGWGKAFCSPAFADEQKKSSYT